MKYLKTYKTLLEEVSKASFEKDFVILPNDMIQELKDICLELNDSGYNTEINNYNQDDMFIKITYTYIIISVIKTDYNTLIEDRTKFVYTNEILEVTERIKDYISSQGYEMKLRGNLKWGLKLNEEYYYIYIYFTKK